MSYLDTDPSQLGSVSHGSESESDPFPTDDFHGLLIKTRTRGQACSEYVLSVHHSWAFAMKLPPIGNQLDATSKYHHFVICIAAGVTAARNEHLPFAAGDIMIFYMDERGPLSSLCPIADQHLAEVMERLAEYTFTLRAQGG